MKLELFCWILCVTGFHGFVNAIHNGEYRSVKDYPFMAQLYGNSESYETFICGATILSEYWMVTAAHCAGTKYIVKNYVRTGSSTINETGMGVIDVEQIFVYGDYEFGFAADNDIALIKLKSPIEFDEYQQPIQITKEIPKVGDDITFVGFGAIHHSVFGDTLRTAQTTITEDKDCFDDYKQKYTKNMICTSTKHVDLCYGDSGGPAIRNNKLIGVISQGCEYTRKHTKPNILTKVANYYDWILETTGIKYTDLY